jgi:hypothetical protein
VVLSQLIGVTLYELVAGVMRARAYRPAVA